MKKKWFIIPALCFVLVIVLFRCIIYIGYVPSESMEPTIPAGSKIVGIRIFHELHVGNIIVFEHEGTNMVKRIAAGPGDSITNSITHVEYIVPEKCYYVLGDNAANSFDSRYWDEPFIEKQDIIAVLIG